MRKNRVLIISLILLMCMNMSIMADEYEPEHSCEIHVDAKKSYTQGEVLLVYQLGEIDEQENSLVFKWKEEYGEIDSETVANLEKAVAGKEESGRIILNKEGRGTTVVSPGIYLLVQENKEGMVQIQSSVVSLPQMNDNGDGWKYEIEVFPKVSKGSHPQTGDDTNLCVIGLVFLLSGAGLICGMYTKRKSV